MGNVFFKLLNMSIAAGWLVLAVTALRLVFKKAPRWVFCVLWAMVALRLALPFSVQSPFSVVPSVNTVSVVTEPVSSDPVSVPDEYSAPQTAIPAEVSSPQGYVSPSEHSAPESYVSRPAHTETDPSPVIPGTVDPAHTDNAHQQIQRIVIKTGIPAIDNTISAAETERAYTGEEQTGDIGAVLFWIWASGAALMASYAAFSYLRLRLRLRCSIKGADGAYVCDTVDTPFILGLFRPRIYVPSGMNGRERSYVLAHEKAHLRRFDHLWKPLGYLMLAAYWFNPLMWLAYIFFCRDIEIACDEKVVKTLDTESKAGYSQTLLDLNRPRRMISACPLAFGEVGVKERIKKVLSYKKPTLWILIAALLLTTVLAVCLMTDPKGRNGDEESSAEESSEEESSEEESSEEESSDEESVEDLEPTPDEYFEFEPYLSGTLMIRAKDCEALVGRVVIPAEHEGSKVAAIGIRGFSYCTGITEVVIPENVVALCPNSFENCTSLKKVSLPDSLKAVYERAFENCTSLESITIPRNTEQIEASAFKGCNLLKTVNIASDSLYRVGVYVFDGCDSLEFTRDGGCLYLGDGSNEHRVLVRAESTDITEAVINDSTVVIASRAFENCSRLSGIAIPQSVIGINEYAFKDCSSLKKAVLGKVAYMDSRIFTNCSSLERFGFPEGTETIPDRMFAGCVSIREIVIPETVTSIGNNAFLACSSLEAISIPQSVKTFGKNAFCDCESLETAAVGEGAESVAHGMFMKCDMLRSVSLPSSITGIQGSAFAGCAMLEDIYYAGTVEQWNALEKEADWDQLAGDYTVHCSDGVIAPNQGTPISADYLEFVGRTYYFGVRAKDVTNLPETLVIASEYDGKTLPVQRLETGAFTNSSIVRAILPEGMHTIDAGAFGGCKSLKSVYIPSGVRSLRGAFMNCTSLAQVDIPDTVTNIEAAFQGAGLRVVKLPEKLKYIGKYAFSGCYYLRSVTIPVSVVSIREHAFYKCSKLKTIYYAGTAEQWNAITKAGDWDEGTGAYAVICSDAVLYHEQPEGSFPALEVSDFVSVDGGNIYYTCETFPGKTAVIKTEKTGGLATLKEFFVIDAEYTDPGEEYLYRVYLGRRYTRSKDGSFDPKRTYAVVALPYDRYRCIEDEPEILGELVIVDYKDVHGLGEGEGKSVVAPFTGLGEFGEYGDQVLMREGSGFAVCFGVSMAPIPDWPLWRVYDSAGHIRTLPVEDSQRWSVSHVEFDKLNSDPDAVIVTLENGNTFKANLRDTRVLADDEEAVYYYCYESSRSDSVPEIIYKGVIDPNSNLEGVKKVVVFPGENEYPVFTIKREYKEVSVGSTSTIGKMNMYIADYIVREDGVNRVVPDNIVVTYKNENDPNAAPEIIPLAGMLNSASDLRNIDVFGKVYTYSRSYIADNISYHETHVFCVPEAEKTLRHIVCHYASNSYDNQYLVLQFYGNGTRIWYMIVDRAGNIRSLPVPDDRIGDVTRVYSVNLDADGGLDGYDPGDMIVTFASGETVTAKLSDTRVLTGKEADEYYSVYGG